MGTKRSVRSVRQALIAGVFTGASILGQGCGGRPQDVDGARPDPVDAQNTLRIALPAEPLGALLALAVERGYVADEGLAAEIVDTYPSGQRALSGLLAGEVDVALSAETPIVFQSFEHTHFRIVATVGSSDDEPKIVARRDRGIVAPADLRGKRVATQRASAVHYFLYLFLLRHGMREADVELTFMKAEELPDALIRGDIDAFSMREPFVGNAKQGLDEKAVVFTEPGLYVKTFNLVVRDELIANRPEAIRALLRALVRAEDFARGNRQAAMDAVAGPLQTDRAILDRLWPELELRVFLGQGLLSALEDEARWALDRGLIEAEHAPNYSKFIAPEPLMAVKNAAVTLIRSEAAP